MRLVGFLVAFAASACVVAAPQPVNLGYAYGYGAPQAVATGVEAPNSYYASSPPPEPLYEQMSPSPGAGYAWIDGSWHWNGYEWVWVGGRWELEQPGYVYVTPYYNYVDGAYVYTPGYWARPEALPQGWGAIVRDHRDGRPPIVSVPPSYHPQHPIGVAQPGVRAPVGGTYAPPARPGLPPPRVPPGGYQQPVAQPPPHYVPSPQAPARTYQPAPPPTTYQPAPYHPVPTAPQGTYHPAPAAPPPPPPAQPRPPAAPPPATYHPAPAAPPAQQHHNH